MKAPPNVPAKGDRCFRRGFPAGDYGTVTKVAGPNSEIPLACTVEWDSGKDETQICSLWELEKAKMFTYVLCLKVSPMDIPISLTGPNCDSPWAAREARDLAVAVIGENKLASSAVGEVHLGTDGTVGVKFSESVEYPRTRIDRRPTGR